MPSEHDLIIASAGRPSFSGSFLNSLAEGPTKPVFLSVDAQTIDMSDRANTRTIRLTGCDRAAGYREVARCLEAWEFSRILCLPGCEDDLRIAVAAADISGKPLALYLVDKLPERSTLGLNAVLAETLQKARVCFALTEGIRAHYQKQFPKRIWLVPPVLPSSQAPPRGSREIAKPLKGVFLGHPGAVETFRCIRQMLSPEALQLTWLNGSGRQANDPEQIGDWQIARVVSASAALVADTCQGSDFLLVAGTTLDETSTGGRTNADVLWAIVEALVASGRPILLVERSETAASRSVQEGGLGATWYLQGNLEQKLAEIVSDPFRHRTLETAGQFASRFTGAELVKFIWDSLALGRGVDDRYEKLFSGVQDRLTPYVEADPPSDLHWEFRPDYANLTRLSQLGYKPDFICDVGASTGFWSHIASRVYPSTRFYLIEPLLEQYLASDSTVYRLHPEFVKVPSAAGAKAGRTEMQVSHDLYGSSLSEAGLFPDSRRFSSLNVPVSTLDEISSRYGISGRGILKVDVQFTEHAVLEGAAAFIDQIDYLFIETNLKTFVPGTKTFAQLVEYLQKRNFECVDFGAEWRDPSTGQLLQKDVVFGRMAIPPSPSRQAINGNAGFRRLLRWPASLRRFFRDLR
ncbi:MAG TPA: FkbM family methyltransferase [Chthoniobacterales bacterium]